MCTAQYFQPFGKLPKEFQLAAIQIGQFCADEVSTVKDSHGHTYFSLDWVKLTTRVKSYKGDDLTFDKLQNNPITTQSQSVDVMVGKITTFLKDALSIVLSTTEVTALAANILATFTDLKDSESKDWASWSSEEDQSNSSWEYRLLYAVPVDSNFKKTNPQAAADEDYFYALVTTTTLTADISTKTEWWGLEKTTTKNFSAEITAMELIVGNKFKNPPSKY